MDQVDGGNTTASYNYSAADGLRVAKGVTVNSVSTTTAYVYSGSKPIAEYVNGALTTEYVYAGSQLLATLDASGNPTYHHFDHLSDRVDTDAYGNVVRTYGHLPYGDDWYETGTASKWKFTSYERDAESEPFDYADFRYYSNLYGRFVQPDKLAGNLSNPQSLNRYRYAGNDPVNSVDPTGMKNIPGWLMLGPGAVLGFGGGFGDCTADGVDTPCSLVSAMLQSGAAVQCPNNECDIGTATPYQCLASVCGYMTLQYANAHENVCGAVLCTDNNYTQWVIANNQGAIESQREALAQAIADNSNGQISYAQALDALSQSCAYVQGGNCNFETSLAPGDVDCGGDARCNGIHFPGEDQTTGNYYVHLDTANPFSGVLGFLEHSFVDVFLGNTVYYVIPRPWP